MSEEDCDRQLKEGVRRSPGAAIAPVAPPSSTCRDLSASLQVVGPGRPSNAPAPVRLWSCPGGKEQLSRHARTTPFDCHMPYAMTCVVSSSPGRRCM